MRTAVRVVTAVAVASLVAIISWNYFVIGRPVGRVIAADPRNGGIRVGAHFGRYVNSETLVIDLRTVTFTNSAADVFRVLLQVSSVLKDVQFERIVLAHRGEAKFILRGEYFHEIGEEYGRQNPVYTMRTFPAHLYRPDGTSAYSSWAGGLLGIVSRQMEDFTDFHRKWYLADLVALELKRAKKLNESSGTQATSNESIVTPAKSLPSSSEAQVDVSPAIAATSPDVQPSFPHDSQSSATSPLTATSTSSAEEGEPRPITFVDHIKAFEEAPRFYLDERAQTYHLLTCSMARQDKLPVVIKPVIVLKRYPPHTCVQAEAKPTSR